MFKIYGSEMCPDCVACKKNFDHYKVGYEFIDITKNLKNLHDFLVLRDTLPVFAHCKEAHDIGLPALVKEDGSVFLSWEKYLEENGNKVIDFSSSASTCSCSADHKGC